MKFAKKKVSALAGDTEIHYTCDPVEPGYPPFKIVASFAGAYFDGRSPTIGGIEDLEVLAKVVGDAMAEHRSLLSCKIQLSPMH